MRQLATLVLVVVVSWFAARTLHASEASEALARGEGYVQKTCVGCHAGPRLEVVVSRRLDSSDVHPIDLEPLSTFLATHHVRDDSLRTDVIAYLRTRLTTASQEP